ncbi:unnamed protein product [Alternaria alternata]
MPSLISWGKHDILRCERFLKRVEGWVDPTWGFYVYGTYTRPQKRRDSDKGNDEGKAQEKAVDSEHFQAVLNKLHAHAADTLRYEQPEPYNQQLIDTLRIQPAAYLPGASLADVCEHFRQNAVSFLGAGGEVIEEGYNCGPKTDWCLIIDDDSLDSIENGPEPIGPTPPDDAMPWTLKRSANRVFVKLLSKNEFTTEEPKVLAAQGRGGTGQRVEWHGWCKFYLRI